ncbi:MAG: hypothetical protein ACJAWL_001348 [Motiliproteus sp.]|jgi:hypothetical protein
MATTTLNSRNNTFTAGAGNHAINGNGGNDTISAGAGNSKITVLGGNSTITAGAGNSTVIAGHGNNTITTGAGDSGITAGNGINTIATGAGVSIITVGNGINTIATGAGNSKISAGAGNNTIATGAGNNTIEVTDGNNTIATGAGVSTITALHGKNIIATGAGDSVISAGNGGNIVSTGAGINTVTTGTGDDIISTAAGDDVVNSGGGSDTVSTAAGNDELIYSIEENREDSTDFYDGGAGYDTLKLELTRDDWSSAAIQTEVAEYLDFVAANTGANGEDSSASFTFKAFDLTVSKVENLEVYVDGNKIDPALWSDPSIVVFDLVNGVSSDHSDRQFDADVQYTIYVLVDELPTEGSDFAEGFMWEGGSNLGADEVFVFVGSEGYANGRSLPMYMWQGVGVYAWADTQVDGNGNATTHYAGIRMKGEVSVGRLGSSVYSAELVGVWTGTAAAFDVGSADRYTQVMPAGVLTSQGMV